MGLDLNAYPPGRYFLLEIKGGLYNHFKNNDIFGLLGACVMYPADKSKPNLNLIIGARVAYLDNIYG